jgi:hypothetical protein
MDIGIDPGMSGGIAIIRPHVECYYMPEDEDVLLATFQEIAQKAGHEQVRVFIEDIPKWCGMGRFAKQTIRASSLAVLYGNFKLCQGICMGLGFEVTLLTPQKWQKKVGCQNTERLEKYQWKKKLRAHAQSLFPEENVVAEIADAMLIGLAGTLP